MRHLLFCFLFLAFLAVLMLTATPCSAGVVASTTLNNDFNGFPVNTTNDLILQGAPTLAAGQPLWSSPPFDSYQNSSPNVLNDGQNHTGESAPTTAVSAPNNADWTLTYNLNTTISPAGYAVSQIVTDAVWTNDYAGQSYTLDYTPVGGTSTLVGNFSIATPSNPTPNNPASTQISLTSDTLGVPILNHVASLEFVFHGSPYSYDGVNTQNDQGAYTQIVVTGTAAPEPASFVLFGLGALSMLAVARRRRA